MSATPAPQAQDKRRRRSAARLAAVQALYQMDMTGASTRAVVREFQTHRLGKEVDGAAYHQADERLFEDLVLGVVARQREIDPAVSEALSQAWPLGRIDSILRALLRAASYEFIARPQTAPVVIINEYVDIAKAFFDRKEPRFANAVLDALARRFRPEEMPPR